MSDLVERLKRAVRQGGPMPGMLGLEEEAADEIERLTAENARLRKALEDLISAACGMPLCSDNLCQGTLDHAVVMAQAALTPARED